MTKLAAGVVLVAMALVAVSTAGAQGSDVQITDLRCDDDPEIVTIENLGDQDQDLTGWELQSDPSDSETFDLAQLSSLAAGTSVTIQSGPAASGIFTWGEGESVFRDGDPTDYARIVDDAGAEVHRVNCTAGATATPSPTPSPDDIPNGGGVPPPVDGGALSAMMLILIGGTMAAAGAAALALPRLQLRPSPAARQPLRPAERDQERRPLSATAGLAILALGILVFLLTGRRR